MLYFLSWKVSISSYILSINVQNYHIAIHDCNKSLRSKWPVVISWLNSGNGTTIQEWGSTWAEQVGRQIACPYLRCLRPIFIRDIIPELPMTLEKYQRNDHSQYYSTKVIFFFFVCFVVVTKVTRRKQLIQVRDDEDEEHDTLKSVRVIYI